MDFELSFIKDHDEQNYRLVREGIGDAAYFPDAVLGIYAGQHELLVQHLQSNQEKHAGALLFGLCVKHLVTGANNLFRGQAGVMYRETRGAVETAGLAYRVLNDTKAFEVYLADHEHDKTARQAFREQTRSKQLFPNTAPAIVQKLGEHYNHASQKAHTNRMNFLRNIGYSKERGTRGTEHIHPKTTDKGTPQETECMYVSYLQVANPGEFQAAVVGPLGVVATCCSVCNPKSVKF